MYNLTIRTAKYDMQLFVTKFGKRTKKTLKKKAKQLNMKKLSKRMAKIFGKGKTLKLSLPRAF